MVKTPTISEIAQQVIDEVRAEHLVKQAVLDVVEKNATLERYQTALGYKLKKLAVLLREHNAGSDVTVNDVYNFVEKNGK